MESAVVLVQAARSDTKLEARQHPRRRSRWSRRHQPKPLCHLPLAALARRRPVWPDAPRGRAASRRGSGPPPVDENPAMLPPRRPATDGDIHRALPLPIELSRGPAPAYESHRPRPHHASRLFSSQPTSLLYYHHLPHARGAQASQSPLRPHRRRREGEATRSASISGHLRRHASYTTHRSMIPCRPARRCLRELASDPKFPTAAQGASRQGAE